MDIRNSMRALIYGVAFKAIKILPFLESHTQRKRHFLNSIHESLTFMLTMKILDE